MAHKGERYVGSDGNLYQVYRLNRDDNSPLHRHWEPGQYDAQCGCCWLGTAHSAALHEDRVKPTPRRDVAAVLGIDC